nr:MAG TPA: hypothetical protein [Caudoviricetes sp.]
MNKEQQVKEMLLDIPQKIVTYGGIPAGQHLYVEQRQEIAEALYNAGYRKVSVSEAELQELNIKYYNEAKDLRRQLADTEAENKRLSEELGQTLLSIATVKGMNAMCNIDYHREQAVKKFADELKAKVLDQTYINKDYNINISDIYKMIEEALKEY